ncbi:UDP-N-acetylmuramoyl-tripeptide--D-alanyl-D-alanine ligase [Endobacterium cereale]|nr:UDP-N-acetylmuramoyl-tripeptide--D-alanyl-D-alanine ligase [Endobacterium cereale]MEB2843164.1 UDP-N-acetylmuramoyl-tripeptide--D-alanyl-D-alanine ligase [Endobacterium cereale]
MPLPDAGATLSDMLALCHPVVQDRCRGVAEPFAPFCVFFSFTDGQHRAHVTHAVGDDFDTVWQRGAAQIRDLAGGSEIEPGGWLRIDWIDTAEEIDWLKLRTALADTKRNYFRFGIAFDRDFRHALLEQELNANAILYAGNTVANAQFNAGNLAIYAQRRFGHVLPPFADDAAVLVFSTSAVFCEGQEVVALHGRGLEAGRRLIRTLDTQTVMTMVRSGSDYLARQVGGDGRFVYGYHPCFDRQISAYNTLRHASTTYAMIEAFEVTRDAALKVAIERSLVHLTGQLIRSVTLADGRDAAFLVDAGGEIKLGGNAVAILALVKHNEVTGDSRYLGLMEKLAVGISSMQDEASGGFVHVLDFPDLRMKQAFRTIYYDGEAAFGLMRLYGLTRDPRWLAIVERAFQYFIREEHWRHHDHWLGYCVNELTRYRPEERYFRFGLQNVAGYLDFVTDRITTFPTLLEMMMAARDMLMRLQAMPDLHHLFGSIDLGKFERALEARARHLLNGFFWPEMAMFFRNPARIAGSFFIRHQAFRVRIDDVEHYLSGYVAYLRHLAGGEAFHDLVVRYGRRASATGTRVWTAATVAEATGGRWRAPPADDWMAKGLCTHAPAMREDYMAVVRFEGDVKGMTPVALTRMPIRPAAIITSRRAQQFDMETARGVPVLDVADTGSAVFALGAYARKRMRAKILAVTGSVGKTTTVAMLAHALGAYGETGVTDHNANLPHGVAWNLASMPFNAEHVVLELAIGKMGTSSRLARPHLAMVANIQPAHLAEGKTITDIARTKAAIFAGMEAGGIAVINRDMLEWQTVYDEAVRRRLTVVHYGTSEDCDVQMVHYLAAENRVTARVGERRLSFRLAAAGRHMGENALGVLAAVTALGYAPDPAINRLAGFQPLPGRGQEFSLLLDGRRIDVIDDAYNANPGSMRAGLERLSGSAAGGRRVAVLSEMAELGPDTETYHTELASLLAPIDRVYLAGTLYRPLWASLPPEKQGGLTSSVEEMKTALLRDLQESDLVLFKGSHSTGMHELVNWLRAAGSPLA